ncbi:MAG: TauD/TfdA family dioxygenase [Acidimicrobiales bacterium]
MSPISREPVDHPSAWKGNDFGSIDDVSFVLESRHLSALDTALTSARAAGLTLDMVEKHNFDLSPIADDLASIEHEILHGRGIIVLRGFPVGDYSLDDIEIMYWGLGCHLGTGESQSNMGDRLGRVEDVSGKDLSQRAYRNSVALMMHTDLSDIIGMLSIRKSPTGGLSSYVSAAAIHNEILATRPDHLDPLFEGFRYHRFGAEAPGEDPITPHPIPVLSMKDGHLSARIVPDYVYMAAEELGEPIPDFANEALDHFNEAAARPDLRFDVMLEPGDVSFINNYTVLHTRSAFDDGATEDQKRLLLRLWLSSNEDRPIVDSLEMFTQKGIAAQPGKGTYYTGPTDPESQVRHARS